MGIRNIAVPFTYGAHGIPKGKRAPRNFHVDDRITVAIRTLSEEECPVVARFAHAWRCKDVPGDLEEIRHDGTGFYRELSVLERHDGPYHFRRVMADFAEGPPGVYRPSPFTGYAETSVSPDDDAEPVDGSRVIGGSGKDVKSDNVAAVITRSDRDAVVSRLLDRAE